MIQCEICDSPAHALFTWPVDGKKTEANMCELHCNDWWSKYKNTTAGYSLIIQPPKEKENGNGPLQNGSLECEGAPAS
jgi:hypothetical protein